MRRTLATGDPLRTARRRPSVTTAVIAAALLTGTLAASIAVPSASADLPATTDTGNWLVRSTGLTAGAGVTDGAPNGVAALYDPAGTGTQLARWANGTVAPLGPSIPEFWLGADTPATPLLVSKLHEQAQHIDGNGDGDQTDVLLTTSLAGAEPVVRFALSTGTSNSCGVRLNDAIAVFCRSELAEGVDLGGAPGTGDQQVVLVHADGTIEETSTFVTGVYVARLLGDGSALVGSVRVLPDGTIVSNRDPAMFVSGMVGTTAVGSNTSNQGLIVPETGPTVSLGSFPFLFPVGDAMWVQTNGGELCRVEENTSLTCLGIHATLGTSVTPIGDDAAIVEGTAFPTPDATTMWIVPAAGSPEPLDLATDDWVLPLGDGTALAGQSLTGAHRLFHITSTGGVTPIPLAAGGPFGFAIALGDGRALLKLLESPDNGTSGIDFNGDGDFLDLSVHLFADDTLTEIGAEVNLSNSFNYPSAIALEPGGAILVGVDESTGNTVGVSGTDRNGDGDVSDMVGAIIDDGVVRNLGIAVAGASLLDVVTPISRRIATNQALFVVPERFQGDDLNGDGDTEDHVTMLLTDIAHALPYASSTPDRLLDTRLDGPQRGYSGPKPSAGQTIEVPAPDGAGAVVLNVTGLNADLPGFVSVYPCGEPLPTVSNLNLTPGLITPNLVISKVGANGNVCIFTQRSADLIADLAGTFPLASAYTPLSPTRVLDTRADGPQTGYSGPMPVPGQVIEITAPAGAAAVVMNVTGLDATQEAFVTVYPCGEPLPRTSNLNLTPGIITPNLTITRVGSNGKVCLFTQRAANLIADLAGTFPAGSGYTPITPERVLDTRPDGPQVGYTGPKPTAGQVIEVTAPAGASAVVMNVTGLEADTDGFVTVYPCGGAIPTASNLNLAVGRITPNLTVTQVGTQVGANGKVCIYTQRSAHLIADLAGTFGA